MPKPCIICDKPAGSREHVFPASLGGRRTNKQIYCGKHNEAFSPLAATIAGQLKVINALLSVRPDHSAAPAPHFHTTRAGRVMRIFNGEVRSVDLPTGASAENDPIQLSLGGTDGLRAIAYIAMTFFAHHFQDWVRGNNLVAIKEFVRGAPTNEFVWWESADFTAALQANPFPFGHTIRVGARADAGSAAAVISLFGSLTFGIDLGPIVNAPDRTVTIFVDPHAEHPPNDIVEIAVDEPLVLSKPEPLQEHLMAAVQTGTGEKAFRGLFERIERWTFDRTTMPVLAVLNAARGNRDRLSDAIYRWLADDAGRVFSLMEHVTADFRRRAGPSPDPVAAALVTAMVGQVAEDRQRQSGLTELAEGALGLCVIAISQALTREISKQPATLDLLWRYLKTGEGAAIVGRAMLDPVVEALGEYDGKGASPNSQG